MYFYARHKFFYAAPLAVVSFCLVFSGCKRETLFCSWRDSKVNIDAKYSDWGAATNYYDERTKVVLNLANDKDYMYICLVTRNREIEAKIMESGLIIWFDPDRLEKKSFGVKFPTGLKNVGMSIDEKKQADTRRDWHDQEDKSGLIDRDKERLRDKDFNKRLEMLEGLQDRLEILYGEEKAKNRRNRQKKIQKGPDKEAKKEESLKSYSLDEAAGLGIEAKVGRENDYFVYELKIPLLRSKEHPFAIGVNNGQSNLGIETAEINLEGNAPGAGEMRKGMLRNEDEFCLWGTVVFSSAN